MPETKVEHHWHDPTQGQVVKAMYQYLADQGLGREALEKIVEAKIQEAIDRKVNQMLEGGQLGKRLTDALVKSLATTRKGYEENRNYGWTDHLRDVVREGLRAAVTDGFEVVVRPRAKAQDIDAAQAALEKAVRT